MSSKSKNNEKLEVKKRRVVVSQTEFPRYSLAKALTIAQALWENFAGKGAAPHDVALALDRSPTSGGWRNLCGASIAYGLTEGGYAAKKITLTSLGRQIVSPTSEGDDLKGKVLALLQPKIMCEFLKKYDRANFPKENIAANVLVGLGLPKERAERAVSILLENGRYTGVFKETKTGLFVALDLPQLARTEAEKPDDISVIRDSAVDSADLSEEEMARKVAGTDTLKEADAPPDKEKVNKVFISHGKAKEIVNQLKELLKFGKLEPIISVERETTSIPVPDKVFEDMRSCSAAVIHVRSEGKFLDAEGNEHDKINENVLIEIGAAIALYGKRFVLLVQKGLSLPSNLQGLYRCEYTGDKLDYDATMKLLKTFNKFR